MGEGYKRNMKTILRIGHSKTGTTALQSFLAHNRKNLIAQVVMYSGKLKRVKIFLKSYLGNNMPRFYTLIKNGFKK